jgi:xanthine dehydrogenase/oxidase
MNLYKEGQLTHFSQKLEDFHVPRLLRELRSEAEFDRRRIDVDQYNARHQWRKRGIAMIPTKFGVRVSL